jgi:hypothetical protein
MENKRTSMKMNKCVYSATVEQRRIGGKNSLHMEVTILTFSVARIMHT